MPGRVTYVFALSDRFSAAARRVSRSMEGVRRKFSRLAPVARKASAASTAAFASITRGAKTALKSGIAPLLAGFAGLAGIRKFLSVGMEFEDAMADLSAITGATGEDLAFLEEQSKRLGVASRQSSAKVATAFKLVASAKSELLKDPRALTQITEQVLLLANTGVELEAAAVVALSSLNQFGAGADQASRFVNVLAAGAKIGASELIDTGEALKNAGSVASVVGSNFEETNAAIQVLAKAGQKGAEAGTGLRGVMLKLNKAIPFEQVGGFTNALEILAQKNLSVAQLQKIFGEESIKAGAVLVKNVPVLKQWTKELTGTNEAQKQAEIRLRTTSARLRGIGVILGNVLIDTFQRLGPDLDQMVEKMKAFAESITREDVESLVAFFKDLISVAQDLAKIVAELAPMLRAVAKVAAFELPDPQKAGAATRQFLIDKAKALFGIEGGNMDVAGAEPTAQSSTTDVNVNLNAPKGIVQSVKSKTTGKVSGLNVGINMAEAM